MVTLDFVVVRSWALELKHQFLRAGSTVEVCDFSKPVVRLFNPVAEALEPFVVSVSSPAHLSFNKKALRFR
ncbi:hypothetical protein GBA52_015213 [Prunus armeniaca]|nr:hypothetical protein GBA52_015213 [Prunus armeniaca]